MSEDVIEYEKFKDVPCKATPIIEEYRKRLEKDFKRIFGKDADRILSHIGDLDS